MHFRRMHLRSARPSAVCEFTEALQGGAPAAGGGRAGGAMVGPAERAALAAVRKNSRNSRNIFQLFLKKYI